MEVVFIVMIAVIIGAYILGMQVGRTNRKNTEEVLGLGK